MKHRRWVKMLKPVNQIAIGNNSGLMKASGKDKDDSLEFWYKVYFTHAVTTSQASRKVQTRDSSLFVRFADKLVWHFVNFSGEPHSLGQL